MHIKHWWFTAPLRLRSILRRKRIELELDDELRFHLDHKIEAGIADGLSPDEARYAALRAMEGLEQRKEEIRDMRRVHWLTDFADDVRYASRSLRRTAGFTAFVAVTLALGIGINAAIFPLFDGLILRPLPVPDPGAVVTVVSTTPDNSLDGFSYREYLDVKALTKSYDGLVANEDMEAVGFSADRASTPRVKGGMMVSGNYFQVLGVQPRLGRGFREDEDQVPGRDAVVVLGPDCWKAEFSSDASVLGRRIRLNGTDFTVIGVAPESFPGMGVFARADFYMPLAMARVFSTNPQKNFLEDRDDRELNLRARLKPGVSIDEARNELAALAKNLEREYPKLNRNRSATVHTEFEMRTRSDAGEWKFALTFAILAFAVLLVACTNVAGLLLSRARSRTREIAIRLAIGAGRFRLIRLLLTESLILSSLGGLGGVAIGYGGEKFWAHFKLPSDLPVSVPVHMDARVLWAGLAFTTVSALLCGLAPALQTTSADLISGLKSGGLDVPGRKRLWGRDVLVVAQVSVSLMLLTAAFLMVRGFQHSWGEGAGFAEKNLVMAHFDPRLRQYNASQTQQFYKHLVEGVQAVPGVQSVALTQSVPLGYNDWDNLAFVPAGFQMPRDRENFNSTMNTVNEGYFQTMRLPILRGREFLPSDTATTPRVAVVNEQLARHFWPGQDAVGKIIQLDNHTGLPIKIVGVARTIRYQDATEKPMDFIYLPFNQHPVARMVLMLRSGSDVQALLQSVKEVARTLDPNMPIFETRSYDTFYQSQAMGGATVGINMAITMGLVGLLLAVAGLYGLVAYNVSRRTREIGIRIAIGAGKRDVLRLVMRQGLVLVAIGTVVGLAMGFTVERLLNAMMFEADGVDFVSYLIVVPSMLLITLLAAYVPARKAARIAPTQALRYE